MQMACRPHFEKQKSKTQSLINKSEIQPLSDVKILVVVVAKRHSVVSWFLS